MDISIDKITAFACSEPYIDVYAQDGRGVYTHPNSQGKEVHFNLPPGNYTTENELRVLQYPLEYICPRLPYPIIYRKMKHMRFTVAPNPNFCSIDFDSDPEYVDVVIDPEVAQSEIPFFEYILFHEQGHFYYGGAPTPGTKRYYEIENYCDIFAAKEMLNFGFNPSQCYYACEMSLTERAGAKWRKWKLGQWLKKVKTIDRNKTENMEYADKAIGSPQGADGSVNLYFYLGKPAYSKNGDLIGIVKAWQGTTTSDFKFLIDPGNGSRIAKALKELDFDSLNAAANRSKRSEDKANQERQNPIMSGIGKVITTMLFVGLTVYIIHEIINKK